MSAKDLQELFDQGLSLRQIGERCGLTPSGVGKMAQRLGLVPPGRARFASKPITPEQLLLLIEAGGTERSIAKDVGVSVTTLRRHLAKHALATQRASRRHGQRLPPGDQPEYHELVGNA